MIAFIIKSNKGYFVSPQIIGTFAFPLGYRDNKDEATPYPFKSAAEWIIKKYKIINPRIEETEYIIK